MPLRTPRGRASRLWLVRRLEVARRGVEVLDQKRQTLLREQRHLSEDLARATRDWESKALGAAAWNDRAVAIAGERRLRLGAAHVEGPCEVEVGWKNALGTVVPVAAVVRVRAAPDFVALGGGSAVSLAAGAHAAAVAAAAEHAAVRFAYEAVTRELAATTRRQRAIERRWIPEHEAALARIALELDEQEREDIARVRRALDSR